MRELRRVVITGRGVLSPLGCDWPSFSEALRAERTAPVADMPSAVPDDPLPFHPVPAFACDRGEEPLSALATAAVRQALADAGIETGGRLDGVGLVMNTVLGPSGAVATYLERLRESGPRASRPAMFVDTLLSMPASRVGIALGLRGSTAVLAGSSALEVALDWVRHGREHTVVAGGGEYHSPKCARYLRELARRSGAERALLAQGAAFVVLEAAEHADARGATAYAELLGSGGAGEPQDVAVPWSVDGDGRAFAQALREALADARATPADVQYIALAAAGDAAERCELAGVHAVFGEQPVALLRPKRLLGEALGAGAGLGLLAALAVAPDAVSLANAFEMGGAVSSLAVRGLG